MLNRTESLGDVVFDAHGATDLVHAAHYEVVAVAHRDVFVSITSMVGGD